MNTDSPTPQILLVRSPRAHFSYQDKNSFSRAELDANGYTYKEFQFVGRASVISAHIWSGMYRHWAGSCDNSGESDDKSVLIMQPTFWATYICRMRGYPGIYLSSSQVVLDSRVESGATVWSMIIDVGKTQKYR